MNLSNFYRFTLLTLGFATFYVSVFASWGKVNPKQASHLSLTAIEKFSIIEEGNRKGLINGEGEVVIPAQYDDLGWPNSPFQIMENILGYKEGKKWGLINTQNKQIT
ncbi:WG repeat-containing protein, partial [Xanthovirga aplysinae]|uniref:WG repeat-containing protein n=1 Tax=Xanthovirga aplysinae TaxID=2529853 RepID=UPI001656E9A6